jgi:hypothetical protein
LNEIITIKITLRGILHRMLAISLDFRDFPEQILLIDSMATLIQLGKL